MRIGEERLSKFTIHLQQPTQAIFRQRSLPALFSCREKYTCPLMVGHSNGFFGMFYDFQSSICSQRFLSLPLFPEMYDGV
jgi:hypothetical protein